MDWIYNTWPWYISGPLLAFGMFMLIMVDKKFGLSSNLKAICSICGAGKIVPFFRYDWRSQQWNLLVLVGIIIGGFIASHFLTSNQAVVINPDIVSELNNLGFVDAGKTYLPEMLFSEKVFKSPKGILILTVGGFFVGFGARYAGGCTSGHAISGLSNLQLPSLIAVIGFFIGGLFISYCIFPLIF